jgi:hypothetical protein
MAVAAKKQRMMLGHKSSRSPYIRLERICVDITLRAQSMCSPTRRITVL